MRAVATSAPPRRPRYSDVTVERLDRAIHTVAEMMVRHDMPQLIVTIRFLEAEQDRLRQETAAMDYGREILRRRRNKGSNTSELNLS